MTLIRSPLVAPRVGVWIETYDLVYDLLGFWVAPRVGVWIETPNSGVYSPTYECRAPCGRVD